MGTEFPGPQKTGKVVPRSNSNKKLMGTSSQAHSIHELKRLQNCIETIPVSTASCERGFSKMNIVSTALRTRLTVQHMSSLMFISINGPPLSMWQPLKYVKSWLALNHRIATYTQGPSKMAPSSLEEPSLQTLWKFM